MRFFGKKKKTTPTDLPTEVRRLRAENENLRLQLQQHWEIIYQYEKKMTERRRHHHRRAEPASRRIRELEHDNKILAKYVINTNH